MYLMYIDESGDVGTRNSPTNYFVLSAIVIHETNWLNFLNDLIEFRRNLKKRYGLLLKEEIHASEFINGRPKFRNSISPSNRRSILNNCLNWLNSHNEISVITVCCNKQNHKETDIFEYTWEKLIQRLENTLLHENFPGGFNLKETGIVVCDNTDGKKLRKLIRKMRRYNTIPSKFSSTPLNKPLNYLIKDPIFRDSAESYLHQMVDVLVYFARQYYEPNKINRRKGLKNYYVRFTADIINTHATSKNTPAKIVEV